MNLMFICDLDAQSIKIIDINTNTFNYVNPGSYLKAPYCVYLDKNHLFIGDHYYNKIFKFEYPSFNFVLEYKCDQLKTPYSICINSKAKLLYASDWRRNLIFCWNSSNGKLKARFKINSPLDIKFLETKRQLYVTSLNCIFIIDETTMNILNTIKYKQWVNLRGISIDNQMNILVLARENKAYSESQCLFLFDSNGDFKSKVDLYGLYVDFAVIGENRIVACRGPKKPCLFLFEFK